MSRILLTCAFILIVSWLHGGAMGRKPRMIPSGEEIHIQEGDPLEIECHSEKRVHFSTERLTGNYDQSPHHLTSDESSGRYTFQRPNTTSADTGWYACAEEDTVIENDDQVIDHSGENISWIYVYVNSSEPFAVMDAAFETIQVLVGSDVVIPCRPTSPNLSVILEGEDVKDIPYDPRIGFTLREVGQQLNARHYECRLNETDGHDGTTWPSYDLFVQARTTLVKPTINQDKLGHAVFGDDLTLECTITVREGTAVILNWIAPNSVPRSRLHFSAKQVPDKIGTTEIWKTELIVKNVQASDDGDEYICIAKGASSESSRSTKLQIWDPEDNHIDVNMDGNKLAISVSKGETAVWKINIHTHPKDFDWKWSKVDGSRVVTSVENPASRYSHNESRMDHWFRISKTHIRDSGNYTLLISTSKGNKTVVLPLTVEGKPEDTHIDKTPFPYAPGKSVIFSCHSIGLPLPNVTWTYVEYPNFPSVDISVNVSLTDFRNEVMPSSPYLLSSDLNITLHRVGDLICRTCNKIGCNEASKRIILSDTAESFSINGPESVVEGDNVNLTCNALRANFTDLKWDLSEFDDSSDPPQDNRRFINVTKNLTLGWTLEIINVSMSDAGVYSCRAQRIKTGYRIENHTLNVLKPREARIKETNMNDSSMFISRDNMNKNITLTCVADGIPIPKVSWYKNEELLERADNQYDFSDDNFNFYIRFFQKEDCGKYLCKAENSLGYVEHYVDVKIEGDSPPTSNIIWISLICVLIVVIGIVISYMLKKVRREKRLRKELLEAGLTHFREGAIGSLNPELTVDEQAELLPYHKKWEFPREQLNLGKQLGSGAFGVVMKAEARDICVDGEVTTVAVKMVRRSADPSYMKALSSELKIMIHLGRHINVVNLLGACTKTIITKRELFVIVEYCRFGNLHNYLQRQRDSFIDQIDPKTQKIDPNIGSELLNIRRSIASEARTPRSKYAVLPFSTSDNTNSSNSNDGIQLVDYRTGQNSESVNMSPDGGILSNNSVQPGWRSNYRGDYKDQNMKPICTQDLLCWAWQVSRGMEYLSSRNVLHGDLAARNILLADDNIVKICDFGLAKTMYKDNNYKKKGDSPLPIKWMAIESIRDRIFSTQSDVWSFGIVLWEFFTLARSPYPGMEAEKQYERLIEGYRMERPEYATQEIYEFMLHCWREQPSDRPTFSEIVEKIGDAVEEGVKKHYFDLNIPYVNMNAVVLQNSQSDYLTMMSAPKHNYSNLPNPVVEMHADSAYVSMNRVKKSSQSSTSTPLSNLEESHFEFPPSNHTVLIHENPRNSNEPVPVFNNEKPYIKPNNVQPVRTEFTAEDERKERKPNVNESSGYCNIGNNPHYSNYLGNSRTSVPSNNSETEPSETKLRMNKTRQFSQATISGDENQFLKSQERRNLLEQGIADSYSNPSYVIMSNNRFKEKK